MGFLNDTGERYSVLMAATSVPDRGIIYYATTPDGPFRKLSPSPRILSDQVEIMLAVEGRVPPEYLATRMPQPMLLGEPCRIWEVSYPDGSPGLLAFVDGRQAALLGKDFAAIENTLAELKRAKRRMAAEAARFEAAGPARPDAAADAAIRREGDIVRSRARLARPDVADELDGILGPFRTTMWRPLTAAAEPSTRSSGYNLYPWMAEGENWPLVGGTALKHVLQLYGRTLPEDARMLVGDDAVVQFFYDTAADDPGIKDGYVLRRVFPSRMRGTTTLPPDDARCGGDPLRIVGWSPEPDSSWGDDDARDAMSEPDAVAEFEARHEVTVEEPCRGSGGDKLLGGASVSWGGDWPTSGGRRMVMLFQFDAGPATDLRGKGNIFIDPSDPDTMAYLWSAD